MYKLTNNSNIVQRLSDGSFIGNDPNNSDWIEYQNWLLQGNQPEPLYNVEQLKANKIDIINTSCEDAITAGFISSALGAPHTYDSAIEDQINLIGAVIAAGAGMPIEYKCYDEDGTKQWHDHTPQQMQQVYVDGLVYKVTQLKKATFLKDAVAAATTIEELNNISW